MFYAVLALLTQGKRETSKHSGAIALFDRDFVKQGIFERNVAWSRQQNRFRSRTLKL
jgi:uncharacterized protein (UPF0332 family)